MGEEIICLKKYINEEDYKSLNELKNICSVENINIKLELEYKLNIKKNYGKPLECINEFFYYADDELVGYLGICCFGGNAAELTGMVHPKCRRLNIFKKLYNLALEECKRRNMSKILLVCDHKSSTGIGFIKSVEADYSFSEYGMRIYNNKPNEEIKSINLRKALNTDGKEIAKQNSIYFSSNQEQEIFPEEEEKHNSITYMVELQGNIIGKIRIDVEDNRGFICGFGILPDYRGKGYGREALKAALSMYQRQNIYNVGLDVACENSNALNLYKSCGFVEESIMDYYKTR